MKNYICILFITFGLMSYAQNYTPLDYNFNGTPTHGIKIKTNLPFQHGVGMPTIMIEGFEYLGGNTIDIKLNWYVYNNSFYRHNASSSGAYAPNIKLCNDNGKVSIYINDKKYYSRFTVKAFVKGKSENATMFNGWVAVDEPISGENITTLTYNNAFGNDIVFDKNGNVGIGTTDTKGFKLGVKGKIVAEEVKVASYSNWADFVFKRSYILPTLKDVELYIKEKGHLKDIPNAEDVKANGFFLGEMDSKLLQKIEELTLYTINQEKRITDLESTNKELIKLVEKIIHNKVEK